MSRSSAHCETTEKKPGEGSDERFAPSAFVLDEATNEVVCPLGKRLARIRFHPTEGNGAICVYVADRNNCQACKKRKHCTPNNKVEKYGQPVNLRLEDDRVEAFPARMESDEAKAICKQRAPNRKRPKASARRSWNPAPHASQFDTP